MIMVCLTYKNLSKNTAREEAFGANKAARDAELREKMDNWDDCACGCKRAMFSLLITKIRGAQAAMKPILAKTTTAMHIY
jgi:hypothetical protein